MHISRRGLLAASALLPLAACAAQTAQQIADTAVKYGAILANALANVAVNLQGVPPNVQQQIVQAAKDAAAGAAQLQSGMAQNAAQPVANRIIEDITQVATIAAPYLPKGSPAEIILSNAQTAEPLFLAAVGIFSAGASPNAAASMQVLEMLPKVAP